MNTTDDLRALPASVLLGAGLRPQQVCWGVFMKFRFIGHFIFRIGALITSGVMKVELIEAPRPSVFPLMLMRCSEVNNINPTFRK